MQKIILIVEDEIDISEIIVEILSAKSYQVICANNGKEAVKILNSVVPDLILSDIMMPTMDGFELLEYVKKSKTLSPIPFVFLTARVSKQDIRTGMSKGVDDYLIKPFSAAELLCAIETRLEKHQYIQDEYDAIKNRSNVYKKN